MDVCIFLTLIAFFSAVPAFATKDENPEESFFSGLFLPSSDEIKQTIGAHAEPIQVDRKPAVLGPATPEPVTYSATSNDPEDEPIDPNLSR